MVRVRGPIVPVSPIVQCIIKCDPISQYLSLQELSCNTNFGQPLNVVFALKPCFHWLCIFHQHWVLITHSNQWTYIQHSISSQLHFSHYKNISCGTQYLSHCCTSVMFHLPRTSVREHTGTYYDKKGGSIFPKCTSQRPDVRICQNSEAWHQRTNNNKQYQLTTADLQNAGHSKQLLYHISKSVRVIGRNRVTWRSIYLASSRMRQYCPSRFPPIRLLLYSGLAVFINIRPL